MTTTSTTRLPPRGCCIWFADRGGNLWCDLSAGFDVLDRAKAIRERGLIVNSITHRPESGETYEIWGRDI